MWKYNQFYYVYNVTFAFVNSEGPHLRKMIADDDIPVEITSARNAMGQFIQSALWDCFSDFSITGVVSATKVFDLSKWPAN